MILTNAVFLEGKNNQQLNGEIKHEQIDRPTPQGPHGSILVVGPVRKDKQSEGRQEIRVVPVHHKTKKQKEQPRAFRKNSKGHPIPVQVAVSNRGCVLFGRR